LYELRMLMMLLSWCSGLLSYHIVKSPLEIFRFTAVQLLLGRAFRDMAEQQVLAQRNAITLTWIGLKFPWQ